MPRLRIVLLLFVLPSLFSLCVAVFVVGEEVWWCVPPRTVCGVCYEWRGVAGVVSLSSVPLPCLCVCCHGIVGLGWCLCDRVVLFVEWGDDCGVCASV